MMLYRAQVDEILGYKLFLALERIRSSQLTNLGVADEDYQT